jgi:hypothetical protein
LRGKNSISLVPLHSLVGSPTERGLSKARPGTGKTQTAAYQNRTAQRHEAQKAYRMHKKHTGHTKRTDKIRLWICAQLAHNLSPDFAYLRICAFAYLRISFSAPMKVKKVVVI